MSKREFDILLSFARTERAYAQAIARIAGANHLRVFLDEDYQHEIWGENLVEYLDRTYRERGLYCMILLSEEYRRRAYTKIEKHAAFDRMISQESVYVLPVKVDESWIDGLPRSTAFLDLRTLGVLGICRELVKKLGGSELVVPPDVRVPRVPNGSIPADVLEKHLASYCRDRPVALLGLLVYDEAQAELRKLLQDRDYWDALDAASGPDFEVLAVRDEEQYSDSRMFGFMTSMSLSSFRPRRSYHSKLLSALVGRDGPRLRYPSLVFLLMSGGNAIGYRTISLPRGTIEEVFLRLQLLLERGASAVATWQTENGASANEMWSALERELGRHGIMTDEEQFNDLRGKLRKIVGFVD